MELFNLEEKRRGPTPPLADRMRPESLKEFVGQEHLVGKGGIVRDMLERGEVPSLILWGPPGSGKTTLALIIARSTDSIIRQFSAVLSGVKEIRDVIREARDNWKRLKKKTILFVDEIHRFNKAQQDAFLPYVEDGTITLIGATTENPSFEVNAPLLSRCKVLVLKPLKVEEIEEILKRALEDKEKGLGRIMVEVEDGILGLIARHSQGDARVALNTLELAVMLAPKEDGVRRITPSLVEEALQKGPLLYDKAGEEHYNIVSAFIKSMRGSDPDAALYWLARMVEAGEDPLFIARRMVIFASEDIGNADPEALRLAVAVKEAVHFVGMPEGWIPLAQGATYLASAPKSNASYTGYLEALKDVRDKGSLPVPLHLRNAPTRLMEDLGYGRDYRYPHSHGGFVEEDYFPEELKGRIYYRPKESGKEKEIRERLNLLWKRRKGER